MLEITERQVRCCPTHSSYDELTEHLVREFPDLDALVVAREVARAVGAARFTGVSDADDGLLMCELVARHQLQLLTGCTVDVAKLDPQPHPARSHK